MARSLSLISLLLLLQQLLPLALAAQSWIYATIDGTLVSWMPTTGATPSATAVVSSHTFTFAVTTQPTVPVPVPTPTTPPPETSHHTHAPAPKHTNPVHHSPAHHSPVHHHHHSKPHPVQTPHSTPSHKSGGHHSSSHGSGAHHSGGQGTNGQSGQPQGSSQQPSNNGGSNGGSSGGSSNHGLAVGLGVGLTFGILAIAGVALFFYMRRRKQAGYASASSSIHEEGKGRPLIAEEPPAMYVPTAEPTLPAIATLPSPRNSGASFVRPEQRPTSMTDNPINQPWVPKTRSRLSQAPESLAAAPPALPVLATSPLGAGLSTSPPTSPPQNHTIPRRPVGSNSP